MGTVISICSGKGGVGKSTATLGIGIALAEKGRRVLMIDCDTGLRTLDKLTGIEENLVYDISDILSGACAPINAIYDVPNTSNLFVIPASAYIEKAPSEKSMRKLIPIVKKYYDYVLLDCPAGIGSGFMSATAVSDKAIVVCNPDPVSVRSAGVVNTMLLKQGIHEQRLVINRFNRELFKKIKIIQDLDKVIDEVGVRLLGVIPEDSAMVVDFMTGNKPTNKNKGIMAFKRIASRIEGAKVPVSI